MKLPLSSATPNNEHSVMHNGTYDNTAPVVNGFSANGVMHNTNAFNGTTTVANSCNPSPDSPPSTSMSSVSNSAAASNGAISLSNGRASGFIPGTSTNGTADNSPTTPTEPQPFYTPQLQIKSPLQSCFNMQFSQDSLDVYHDATGSLQRVRNNSGSMSHMMARPHSRRRHASASTTNTNTPDLSATAGILASAKLAARVRTYSCNSTVPDRDNKVQDKTPGGKTIGSPVHIGRLSLSTHSLKLRAGRENQSGLSSPKFQQRSSQPLNSPAEPMQTSSGKEVQVSPKLITTSVQTNTVGVQTTRSVSPHLDLDNLTENQDTEPLPNERLIEPKQSNLYEKSNICVRNNGSSAWRNNYVPSVETDQMIQTNWTSGHTIYNHDTTQQVQDRQVCPQDSAGKHGAEVAMYTFGPVQRRRVGLQRVKEEFCRENLRLEHKAPHLFASSQWQQHNRMSCVYLGYRLFWAVYLLMWTIWAFAGSFGYQAPLSMKAYHFMYMTNWGLWMLTIDANIQAINTIRHFKKMADDGDASYPCMPFRHKVSWAVSNITGTLHFFITASYWITVYPNRSGELSPETQVMLAENGITVQDEKFDEIGFHTHLLPGLYVLLDVCVSATPRRLLHAYWPMAFICCYLIFNLTYYLAGGLDYLGRPAIYPSMDWSKPGMTIPLMCVVVLVVIPFMHGIICALYAARVKIWRILKISSVDDNNASDQLIQDDFSRYVREEDEAEQVDQTTAQEQNV